MSHAHPTRLLRVTVGIIVVWLPYVASAEVLWDNTLQHNVETSGRAFGGGVWSDYIVADNFSAGKPWLLSGIRFETIDIGDWQFESVDVYLYLDRSRNGTSEPLFYRFLGTWSGSGFDTGRRDRGFLVMRYSVGRHALIEPGHYYLGLNANGSGTTGGTFWATSDGGEGGNTPGWYFNGSRWFYEGPPPIPGTTHSRFTARWFPSQRRCSFLAAPWSCSHCGGGIELRGRVEGYAAQGGSISHA
ncbi:MAG: hypothetical protein KatS3mg015_0975 [Fimbriimonadales bacterium]|nr:MAG: hypothetical protein KatS3mg015_0975 [Fimbriimonadales bacterium]